MSRLKDILNNLVGRQKPREEQEQFSNTIKVLLGGGGAEGSTLKGDVSVGHMPSPQTEDPSDLMVGQRPSGFGHLEIPPPIPPRKLHEMPAERRATYLQKENYQLRDAIDRLQKEMRRLEGERKSLSTDFNNLREKVRRVQMELLRICEAFPSFLLFQEKHGHTLDMEDLIAFLAREVQDLRASLMHPTATPVYAEPIPAAPTPVAVPPAEQPVRVEHEATPSQPLPMPEPQPQLQPHKPLAAPTVNTASVAPSPGNTVDLNGDPRIFQQIGEYVNRLDDQQRLILTIIGDTGLARITDIYRHEAIDEEAFNGRQGVSKRLNELKNMGLLQSEKVSIGARGHIFIVFWLSDKGKSAYQYLTGRVPVESEVERLQREHASLEHGYLIKVVGDTLEANGYIVHRDREACTFYVKDEDGNEHRIVFDLVAENEQGERKYIEVERGTHQEDEFFAKLDKIYLFTQDMYFVAPSDIVMHRDCKGRFHNWVARHRGGKQYVNLTAYFTTVERLRNDDWEKIDFRK